MIAKNNASLQITLPKECIEALDTIVKAIEKKLQEKDPNTKFSKSMFIYSLIVDWFEKHVDNDKEAKEVN